MRGQKVFCDVRVFNPLTKCYRTKTLAKVHELNEKEKKVKYAARVVEVRTVHAARVFMFWWYE